MVAVVGAVFVPRGANGRDAIGDMPRVHVIDRVPFVISSPGKYVLAANLAADAAGPAIEIQCDDVDLDLSGFALRGGTTARETAASFGVYASGRKRIRIHGGEIRGFTYGVCLDGDAASSSHGWHVVRRMVIEDCTFRGARVSGTACVIRDNEVREIGGCMLWPDSFAFGIEAIGPEARVMDNAVEEIVASGGGEAVGISVDALRGRSLVFGNTVRNVVEQPNLDIGIWAGTHVAATIASNRISGFTWGIAASSTTVVQATDNEFSACVKTVHTAELPTPVPGRVITAGRAAVHADASPQ